MFLISAKSLKKFHVTVQINDPKPLINLSTYMNLNEYLCDFMDLDISG